jgi:hypothetical protein
MSLAIFVTGVLSFECCFSNLISAFVYGLLGGFLFFALANIPFRSGLGAPGIFCQHTAVLGDRLSAGAVSHLTHRDCRSRPG